MSAVESVELELAALNADVTAPSLAAMARQMALELDSSRNSATSKSMCARSLLEAVDRLRELAPPKKEHDAIDELGDKRAERLADAGLAGAAAKSRS